jgi:hypothetical protein
MEAVDIAPLSLSLKGLFDSFDLLYASAQAYAKSAEYAFVIGKNKKRKGCYLKVLCYKKDRKQQPRISNEDYRLCYRLLTCNECLVFIKARERPDSL